MYSFSPSLRILNGELQTLIGLRDVARISRSRRAQRLFERAEPVARRAVRGFDTGAWSLYSAGGRESTLGYHRLVADFLGGLCRRTGTAVYCVTGRRFSALRARAASRRRPNAAQGRAPAGARRSASRLSKISDVMLQVRDRRGRLERSRRCDRCRTGATASLGTAAGGRHRLRIVAIGPAGTRAVEGRTLRAAKPHDKQKAKRAAAKRGRRRSGRGRGGRRRSGRRRGGPEPPFGTASAVWSAVAGRAQAALPERSSGQRREVRLRDRRGLDRGAVRGERRGDRALLVLVEDAGAAARARVHVDPARPFEQLRGGHRGADAGAVGHGAVAAHERGGAPLQRVHDGRGQL